jgi:hypothetical protein
MDKKPDGILGLFFAVLTLALLVALFFGWAYEREYRRDAYSFCLHGTPIPDIPDSLKVHKPERLRDFLYYSVGIITTTTNFGISPNNEQVQILVAIEAVTGVCLFVFIVAMVSSRAAHSAASNKKRNPGMSSRAPPSKRGS